EHEIHASDRDCGARVAETTAASAVVHGRLDQLANPEVDRRGGVNERDRRRTLTGRNATNRATAVAEERGANRLAKRFEHAVRLASHRINKRVDVAVGLVDDRASDV